MKTYDELLEDEGFWQDLKRKLMENNQRLWSVIWASGGLAAYQLGGQNGFVKSWGSTGQTFPSEARSTTSPMAGI